MAMTSAPAAPKGKGMIITGAVLLGLALLLGAIATVGVVGTAATSISNVVNSQTLSAPGVFETELTTSEYTVYQLADGTATRLLPSDILVDGPSGPVAVGPTIGTETVTLDLGVYEGVASFKVQQGGPHTITIDSADPTEVVVTPSVLNDIKSTIGWVVGIFIAGVMGLVGLILLIVGLVRRSGSKKALAGGQPAYGPGAVGAGPAGVASAGPAGVASAGPAGVASAGPAAGAPPASPGLGTETQAGGASQSGANPPANWYPDPENPGGQRYWDGSAWTEHRA